ncbi:MAG: flagellar type III secretion system protein FlhB [Paracoccaceae bacterium]
MSEGSQDEDKQHEPTQKKLDDARKKGDVAKSTDLITAASYGGFLLVWIGFGSQSVVSLGDTLSAILERSVPLSDALFSSTPQPVMGGIMLAVIVPLLPWFAIPAAAALLSVVAQQAFVVAPDKLQPKASRISMIENAKNKFGRNGLFEFFKSFVKLLVFSVILGWFLFARTPDILATLHLDPIVVSAVLVKMCLSFLLIVLVVSGIVGGIDYLWQAAEHVRKNMMSRKEVTDEAKQQEGDPHIKQQRRQKGYEIAMNQMLRDVPGADVIIVNPTHFAVALKWSRAAGTAPVCVAKGADEIAARIRESAQQSGVPIHRDPPTARAMFAVVEIGEEIRPEHYRAVAAAIRFAETMRKRASGRGTRG